MVLFENIGLLIFAAVVINLHIVPRIFRGAVSFILEIVNIGLHIALIVMMLWSGIPFDEATLFVMLSVFVYTLYYIIFARRRGEESGNDI